MYITLLKAYDGLKLGELFYANDNDAEAVARGHQILDLGIGHIHPISFVPPVAKAKGKAKKTPKARVMVEAPIVKPVAKVKANKAASDLFGTDTSADKPVEKSATKSKAKRFGI